MADPSVPVYGAQNHCDDLKGFIAKNYPSISFNCYSLFPTAQIMPGGHPDPASLGKVNNLPANTIPGVAISAVTHRPLDGARRPGRGPAVRHRAGDAAGVRRLHRLPAQRRAGDGAGLDAPPSGIVSQGWQFRVGDFSLAWEDTTGYDFMAGGNRVSTAWASLPQTDVLYGAIAVSGRSVLDEQLNMIRPKIFIPIHHDPCAYDVYKEVKDQLALIPASSRPRLRYLSDPGDYLNPIIFDPTAKAWKQDTVSSSDPRPAAPATAKMTPAAVAPAPATTDATPTKVSVTLPNTGSAASASTKLSVRIAKAKGSKLAIKISGVPAAGKLKVALSTKTGKHKVAVGSASRTLNRASAATLNVKLSKAARKLLRAHRSLKASLKLTYTATGSRATSVTRTVRITR